MVVTRGYYVNLVKLRGIPPAIFGQQGEFVKPLLRAAVPLAPTTCPQETKNVAGVLGMGCSHLTSASELNSEPVGARGNASLGRVCLYTPIWLRAFLMTYIWQIIQNSKFMENLMWTCQNSKKLAKVVFGYFRSASLASLWKVILFAIVFICYFSPVTPTQGRIDLITPRRPSLHSL